MYRYYYFRVGLLLSERDETRSDFLLRYLFQIAETQFRTRQEQKPVAYLFERFAVDAPIVIEHLEFGILPGDEFFLPPAALHSDLPCGFFPTPPIGRHYRRLPYRQ